MLASAKLLKSARIALGASPEAIATAATLHSRTVRKIEAAASRQSRAAMAVQAALESKGIEFIKTPDGRVAGFLMPPTMDEREQGQVKGQLPFAALLKPARLALGLSLDEVATQARIHPRTVGRVETRGPNAEATAASVAVRDALEASGIEFLPSSEVRGPGFRLREVDI
ncbi:hypothetical protein DWF00_27225 [Bosea caraganae]|uniref:Uncharacterized protein n=1 Tax=Bosea caraganae TaxID=2763117 RepID=A0A370L9F9_9HYPH|nr:hypothetical protein DWF00_27225 [Bosea caraganae]RDJ27952.1 hypothetical protein DWE98_04930 [Bosea caraganae]